ncbi:unnamed protein product, partial [Prorocentrum cordatum]
MGQVLALRSPALPDAAPVVGLALPEDLRRFLLASLPTEKPDLENSGFESHVDHAQVPGHRYLEGYFHAVPGAHDRAVDSIHSGLIPSILAEGMSSRAAQHRFHLLLSARHSGGLTHPCSLHWSGSSRDPRQRRPLLPSCAGVRTLTSLFSTTTTISWRG